MYIIYTKYIIYNKYILNRNRLGIRHVNQGSSIHVMENVTGSADRLLSSYWTYFFGFYLILNMSKYVKSKVRATNFDNILNQSNLLLIDLLYYY